MAKSKHSMMDVPYKQVGNSLVLEEDWGDVSEHYQQIIDAGIMYSPWEQMKSREEYFAYLDRVGVED